MMRTLRCLLHPLVEQTSFTLTDIQPLDGSTGRRYGLLEYRGSLDDGRAVLLGMYQLAAWHTITAEMWVPDDVRRMPVEASVDTVAMHRRVWSYTVLTGGDALARAIVAEVEAWINPFRRVEPGSTEPCSAT